MAARAKRSTTSSKAARYTATRSAPCRPIAWSTCARNAVTGAAKSGSTALYSTPSSTVPPRFENAVRVDASGPALPASSRQTGMIVRMPSSHINAGTATPSGP